MKRKEKIKLICESIRKNRYPLKISRKDYFLEGNCYAYAIGSRYEESHKDYGEEYIYNLGNISNLQFPKTIQEAEKAFLSDMEILGISVRKSHLKEKVKSGEWKIAFFFEEYNDYHDFHFIRQDQNGSWSSKQGVNGIVRKLGRKPKWRKSYTLVGYYILKCKQ